MQLQVCQVMAAILLGAFCVEGGYYKSRPPPPNLPPAKLHYGPKPPSAYFTKQPPFHIRRPIPIHAPRNPIRPPPRPYIIKPTPPTPPPFPPSSWKIHSGFRAPVIKETFHSSPLTYAQNYLHDDDKGPIHTIPAPNLSPADRPHDFHTHQGSVHSALEAVLNHGQSLQSQSSGGYQVTEDPSAYKPYKPGTTYFAPDPDPSLPTIEVTKTFDPHSLPSNGVRPLDVYQQEQIDQQQQQQYETQTQFNDGAVSNSLSPQDLYSLLNQGGGVGAWSQQPVMTPELYQQYLQAASALGQHAAGASYDNALLSQQPTSYNNALLGQHNAGFGVLYHRQHQHQPEAQFIQNFRPQYENFNYNEQTQEGAHGSDSFPSASSSVSVGVKRAAPKDITADSLNSIPNDYKSENSGYLDKKQRGDLGEDVLSNQVDYDNEKSSEGSGKDNKLLNIGFYTTLPNKQTAETLATLAAAGTINNQIMKSPFSAGTKPDSDKDLRSQSTEETKQNSYGQEVSSNQNNDISKGNDERQQYYKYQEQQVSQTEEKSNEHIRNNDETNEEGDYNEDEILDPSDKDQRTNNYRLQNGMRTYEKPYTRNKEEKETQQEEPNYEDTEGDYTQEEEKEIRDSAVSQTTTNSERVPNYNAHQKQLPFGAKLRPKRV